MSRQAAVFTLLVAFAEAAGAIAIVATSDRQPHKLAIIALAVPAGISFVVSGLIALRCRPENRVGVYLVATGLLWLLSGVNDANNNIVWAAGTVLSGLVFIPFSALILSFPTGRLAPRPDRLLVRATTAFVVVQPVLLLFFADHAPSCGDACGTSPIVVYRSRTIERVIDVGGSLFVVGLVIAAGIVLLRRFQGASPALRRVLRPVYAAVAASLVLLLLSNLLASFSTTTANTVGPLFIPLFAAVPFAFLYGILRSRLARASVAGLMAAIGAGGDLRDAIAETLGDPSVELAYAVEEGRRLVDAEGAPFTLPEEGSGRAAARVDHDGRQVGAIVHDATLSEERELVNGVVATVALALDHERLSAELRSQYRLLTTVVATAPSLLVTVDLKGRITSLNAATVEAGGFDDGEELRGRYFWDVFIDPTERAAMIERFHDAAPTYPPSRYENVFTNARGEWRVIAWRSAPVHDSRGSVVAIVAGGLDVTDRKLQEEELRASRLRIVAAGDDARRRLERNLHDGAQQRLVSLSVALRLARNRLESDPGGAAEILDRASGELTQALEELRELAHGIHPAVLTHRGLAGALRSLAERTPIPVEVEAQDVRLPEAIEAAAYYVVSESIANVVKHAGASRVAVRVDAVDGSVLVEVADDGVGGADPDGGSGLRGLADRVAALDGTLRVYSATGGGTRVAAELPLTQ